MSTPRHPSPRVLVKVLLIALAMSMASCSGPEPDASRFGDTGMPLERRVNDLIRRLHPEEKLALLSGAANDRLGIPARTTVPGAMGLSTAFPANIGIAATWNPQLSEQIGAVIAQQARALGRDQVLGPLTGISHSPLSGPVFESYGEDPWLASRMVVGYVNGVQGEGEIATAIFENALPNTRAERESTLWPLESAVTEAGVWAVMPRDAASGNTLNLLNFFNLRTAVHPVILPYSQLFVTPP